MLYQLVHINSNVLLALISSNIAWGFWGEEGILACNSVDMSTLCGLYGPYRAVKNLHLQKQGGGEDNDKRLEDAEGRSIGLLQSGWMQKKKSVCVWEASVC